MSASDNPLPDAGSLDDYLSGWRRRDRGELFAGFPIVASDVVVDIGCGDGTNGAFCVERAAFTFLLDADPSRVATSKWRLKDAPADRYEVMLSDSNPLPLPDGVASKVVSVEVIEHVDDAQQFLRELVRIGKVGAQYLLAVPDAACEHLAKQIAPPIAFQKPNHVRILERDAFTEMVREAGLVIERSTTSGFFHALRWLLFWADPVDPDTHHSALLDDWSRTWARLLESGRGPEIKTLLDGFMPKSHLIIARKVA